MPSGTQVGCDVVDPAQVCFQMEHGVVEAGAVHVTYGLAPLEQRPHELGVLGSLCFEVRRDVTSAGHREHDLEEQGGVDGCLCGLRGGEPRFEVLDPGCGDLVPLAVRAVTGFFGKELNQSVAFEAGKSGVDLAVPEGFEVREPLVPGLLRTRSRRSGTVRAGRAGRAGCSCVNLPRTISSHRYSMMVYRS